MIWLTNGIYHVTNPTEEELASLDAKLERVAPDKLEWYPPGEGMQIRFDEKTRTLWLPRPDKAIEARLDKDYSRVPGQLRWSVPEDGLTLGRIVSYGVAIVSGKLAPDDPIIQRRLASCLPCDALKAGACQTCGCGANVLMVNPDGTPAEKMLYKTLNCPKYQPGFTNALGR